MYNQALQQYCRKVKIVCWSKDMMDHVSELQVKRYSKKLVHDEHEYSIIPSMIVIVLNRKYFWGKYGFLEENKGK